MKLPQKECIEKYKLYVKFTEDKAGGISTAAFGGIPADKKNFIHESISEYGEFDNKPQKIPKGYKLFKSRKGGILVEGIYPNGAKGYFGFGL